MSLSCGDDACEIGAPCEGNPRLMRAGARDLTGGGEHGVDDIATRMGEIVAAHAVIIL